MKRFLFAAAAIAAAAPALAGAGNFTLVNGTSARLATIEIRRFGTNSWKPLAVALAPGAHSALGFADEDCAFDLRAILGGQAVQWTGVNLCEVRSVTLNRKDSGETWVDYD